MTYEDRLFAITARHVVGNNPPEKLLLIVRDKTAIAARVLEQIDPSDEIGGALDLVIRNAIDPQGDAALDCGGVPAMKFGVATHRTIPRKTNDGRPSFAIMHGPSSRAILVWR